MPKNLFLIVFLLCFPARAELVKLDEAGSQLRATLKFDGREVVLPIQLLRSKTPESGGALLIDLTQRDDLAPTALARGMSVAALDLVILPAALRAQALRDLLPFLRKKTGGNRLLGRGYGEAGAALVETGALFDGLLLQDAGPHDARSGAAKAPRSIEVWGSDAYWRAAPLPAPSTPEPEGRRSFFLVGTVNGAGANCLAPNSLAHNGLVAQAPALRALLVALDDWSKGIKPPASRAPAAADLVKARARVWPKIPGLSPPPIGDRPGDRPVPKIDADGNETAGLRLPDRALPIATFTGFAAQKDTKGAPCLGGAVFPFAATRSEREKIGDPRPSLIERYGSRAYFVATMRVVADRLVKERLLLKEDADAYVAAAKQAPF